MSIQDYRVIVTSGPTREYIDPVRFISNPSTGKMGYYIAAAAVAQKPKEVLYICAAALPQYQKVEGARNINVETTQEMREAVLDALQNNTILIMSAAPADYQAEEKSPYKLKKSQHPSIRLRPTPDILLAVSEKSRQLKNFVSVGFAAETDRAHANALRKLHEKNLAMIFLNNVTLPDSGFAVDTNRLAVLRQDGYQAKWPQESKQALGFKILREVENWLELSSPSTTKPTK